MKYYVISKAKGEELRRVVATSDKRDNARAQAKTHGATVATEDEFAELCAKGVIRGEDMPKATKSIMELAKGIAAAPKQRKTVGTKPKAEPKRFDTPEPVLTAATLMFNEVAKACSDSKVALVRTLSAWKSKDGVQLQRRDVYAIIRGHAVGANIADATISTQFQLVRSGKWVPKP